MVRSAAVLFTFVLGPGMAPTSSADAERGPAACRPSQVRLSISTPNNAFTGGRYPVAINLRNASGAECSIEGHPLVVVAPRPFPVVVGDLADFDPNDPCIGPERVLNVKPGGTVHAQVVIGRRCDGAKRSMTNATIAFSAYGKNVSLAIQACRREGVEIDTGPFLFMR